MSHLRDVIHPRRLETVWFLVAGQEPCVTFAAQDQLNQSGRTLVRLTQGEFAARALPASWAMAVVLCVGDGTAALAGWASRNKGLVPRVHFYLHRDCDPRKALRAWHDAGLPLASTWDVALWRDLSAHFGSRLNQQAHDDFCPDVKCPLREH
jgi:hypothetical protein